jgi:hypothetical protein
MREFTALLCLATGGFLIYLALDETSALRFLRQVSPSGPAAIGSALLAMSFGILFWLRLEKWSNDRKQSRP